MKKIQIFISLFAIISILFMACEPMTDTRPDTGQAPTADQLGITISPGSDAFHIVVANTSDVTGIASWDFGNGSKGTGDEVVVAYPIAGTYTIKLTLVTKGGVASITTEYEQTETDFSIFTDPVYINLSGGVDQIEGKTWVLDSLQKGHLGVGPTDGTGLEWWSADPLTKSGTGAYDDEINFKINDFIATYSNKGVSYVKGYQKDDPGYSNPRLNKDDYDVDFTPLPGNWSIRKSGDKNYLTLSGPTAIFPCFDVGAKNNEYEIVQVTENLLELTCFSADEDWTKWHYYLIPKGYVKPSITFDINAVEGADNDVACSLSAFSIPGGQSVTSVTWNFGDGTNEYTTSNKDEVVHHTFMRKGTYTVTAKLTSSLGLLTKTTSISLANNNSAYVEYLLSAMVMYNDFGETTIRPVLGQDCSVTTVSNPNKTMWPNRSNNVALYSKTNQQWANANLELPVGYRFDLRQVSTFKILVYGTAGQQVLLKLENTSRGGNAWQTGTADLIYTIKQSNKWEIAEYNFAGVSAGWDWTGDIFTSDVTTDDRFNHDFYNVVRIMLNPGVGTGTHSFYFDDLAGPHVEGLK